jgi:hypothetical protein
VQQIIRSASRRAASTRQSEALPFFIELCVDIDLAHVVDDVGDLEAIAVREDVVEKRRLPCAEKTGEYGDRQLACGRERRVVRHPSGSIMRRSRGSICDGER